MHRTTIETDVLVGLDAVARELAPLTGADPDLRVCSSAGGGLRLAVVGYEQAVTAEAGRRVGLSAGAKVVHVACGPMDGHDVKVLRGSRPDVVLLVGGTNGGNATVLRHNASRLAKARLGAPVVVAGNEAAADEVMASLASTGRSAVAAANVLPRIGTLEPEGARSAIREVFLRHVIGGKGLSRGPRFASLVRAATPDAVLSGVEVLADGAPDHGVPALGDVLVVDVGGATTDVYSVITPHGEDATLRKEVVAPMWRARTVEGDLGMRWGATATVEAAVAERLLDAQRRAAAGVRCHDSAWPNRGGCRPPRRRWRTTSTWPASRSPSPCDATRVRRRRRKPARTSGGSSPWSGRVACCATPTPPDATRCSPPPPATTRAAGACRTSPCSPSTSSRCCVPPVCCTTTTRAPRPCSHMGCCDREDSRA